MMALEYGRNIMIIDCGIMFPESDMPGIDYIIPDYGYLKGKADRIRGIVITHGHEDHIGALPHLLQDFNAPVYATKLTRGLIEVKLRRNLQRTVQLETMKPGDVIRDTVMIMNAGDKSAGYSLRTADWNITDNQADYARKVEESLKNQGLRVKSDLRNEKIGFKIREHTLQRVPYMLIIGDKELENNTVAVRTRSGEDLGSMSIDDLSSRFANEIASRGSAVLEE